MAGNILKSGVYMVSYADYPPTALAANKVDAELDAAPSAALASVPGAKLTGVTKVTLDGNPGREFTADAEVHGRIKGRIYLVKNRLYQLVAGGSPEKVSDQDVQKFFDSFKLTAN